MSIQLPINLNPDIKTLNCFAMPAAVIQATEQPAENYFLLKSLDILAKQRNALGKNEKSVIVPRCLPFPFWRALHFRVLPYYPGKDVKRCLLNTLEAEKYALLCVNEEYIPNRDAYQQHYYYHEILIYGYEEKTDEFLTVGYDKSGRFSRQNIHSDILIKAYATNKLKMFSFYTIWRRESFLTQNISRRMLKQKVRSYLHPIRSNYGCGAFTTYMQQMEQSFNEQKIDFRTFRTIADRTALLQKAPIITTLSDDTLQSLVKENQQKTERLLFKGLKYTMTPKNISLEQEIRRDFKIIAENEKLIMRRLLTLL